MDLNFLLPELRKLDALPIEVVASCLFEDELPPAGMVGLLNWRMAGKLDRLRLSGYLSGSRHEVVLVPGKPRVRADKLLFFGLGPRAEFDEGVFDEASQQILKTLVGLCARTAVVQLPGRHLDALPAEEAADRFLAQAAEFDDAFDRFFVVESLADQKRITTHMIEERRRVRRY